MKYRIFNYCKQETIIFFEDKEDILFWLNDNTINIDECFIQYYDKKFKKWCNF